MAVPLCSALQTSWPLYSCLSFAYGEQLSISNPISCTPRMHILQSCRFLKHLCFSDWGASTQALPYGCKRITPALSSHGSRHSQHGWRYCSVPSLHAYHHAPVIFSRLQKAECRSCCTCNSCGFTASYIHSCSTTYLGCTPSNKRFYITDAI